MSFSALADNQCVSYNNLQSGVSQGYFDAKTTIPSTNQESTKTAAYTYVNIDPNYPPFALKQDNQLVVKSDLKNNIVEFSIDNSFFEGDITDVTVNGVSISGVSFPIPYGSGATGTTDQIGSSNTVILYYADAFQPSNYCRIQDSEYNNYCIDGFSSSGPGPYYVTFTGIIINTIVAVGMQTGDGGCTSPTPPPVNLNSPFSTVAVSKNTGQYQVAASAFLANPYAAGPLYKSSNYGASWTRIYIDGYWKKVAVSSDGHYMLAVELYGKAYESSDYGATWSDTGLGTHYFTGCAISSDGYYRTITIAQTSLSEFGKIKRSVNFGSWTDATTPSASTCSLNFNAIAMSSNGQYQTVVTGTGLETETNSPYGGGVLYSSDYGANFSLSFQGAYIFIDVTSSPDGTKQIVVYQSAYTGGNGGLFKSTNYGSSWSTLGGAGNWFRATANDTTTNYAIGGGTDYIKNIASLSTITDLTASGSRAWRCIDMDNSGTYILAGTTTNIYRSTNSGTSFTAL